MMQFGVRCKVLTKVAIGRRRKRANWIIWMYAALYDEFDQLHKVGLSTSSEVLLTLTKSLVINSTHVLFTIGYLNPLNRVLILEKPILVGFNHFMTIKIVNKN
jgi:hypothetical protein